MHVGFTGTQRAMTPEQAAKVVALLANLDATDAHHGDCIGADAGFHAICAGLGLRIHIHPPTKHKKRAFCQGAASVAEAKDYLVRNRDIVDAADSLIAALGGKSEYRSGEWATVRYARSLKRRIYLVFPDGSVQEGDRQ